MNEWLIIWGAGAVLVFIIVFIRTFVACLGAQKKLRRADENARQGDWKAAAAAYKEVMAACLADEPSVKLCASKLEEVYRQSGVQADLGRVYEFHRVCADIHRSKTLSESERRDFVARSVAELQQFLAQYP